MQTMQDVWKSGDSENADADIFYLRMPLQTNLLSADYYCSWYMLKVLVVVLS